MDWYITSRLYLCISGLYNMYPVYLMTFSYLFLGSQEQVISQKRYFITLLNLDLSPLSRINFDTFRWRIVEIHPWLFVQLFFLSLKISPFSCSGNHFELRKIYLLAIPDFFVNSKEMQCIKGFPRRKIALIGDGSLDRESFSLKSNSIQQALSLIWLFLRDASFDVFFGVKSWSWLDCCVMREMNFARDAWNLGGGQRELGVN